MNTLVIGAGTFGTSTAFALQILGHKVTIIEQNNEKIDIARGKYPFITAQYVNGRCAKGHSYSGFDAVVSTIFECNNVEIAKDCIRQGIPYFDLGNTFNTSKKINKLAKKVNKGKVFTDLGFAPGLLNVIVIDMAKRALSVKKNYLDFIMYFGSIPKDPNNQLRFEINQPVNRTVAEYFGKYNCIQNNLLVEKRGLEEVSEINIGSWPTFESFNINGPLTHEFIDISNRLKITNLQSKAIRLYNHANVVDFLGHKCGLIELDGGKLIDCGFTRAIKKSCNRTEEDSVYGCINFATKAKSSRKRKNVPFIIRGTGKLTAWQQAVGVPAAAAIHLIMSNLYRISKNSISYEDIPVMDYYSMLEMFWPYVPLKQIVPTFIREKRRKIQYIFNIKK